MPQSTGQADKLQPEEWQTFQAWANRLRQWGLHQLAAALLEAGGPLNLVGAQLVYLSQPVLNGFLANDKLNQLAEMLEQPAHTRLFIRYLREEAQ